MTTIMKKIAVCIVMVLFFLAGPVVLAQETETLARGNQPAGVEQEENAGEDKTESEDNEKKEKNTPFFKSLWQDEGKILSSPLRMKGKHFLLWGGIALVTGILIANDETIYRSIKDYQAKHKWVSDVSPEITKLGLGEWNLGIAGAFYLGGLLLKDKKAKETARLALMTFVHTGVVVQIGKHLSGRQRPSWDNGTDYWAGPGGFFKRYKEGELSHYDAFPSGHTITIFGTATVVAEMYKKSVWVPVLSYSLAALCGMSRVTEDTHWLSDVFLGAVLGYAIGKYVVKKRNRLGKGKLNIYPTANSHQISLGVQYTF